MWHQSLAISRASARSQFGGHLHLVEAHTDTAIAEATGFLRADPEYHGEITGATPERLRIAHAAEGFGMDVELHIAGAARRHCMAAMRNSNFYEVGLVHPKLSNIANLPVCACDYSDQFDSIDSEGYVTMPEGAGLGVMDDWDAAEPCRVESFEVK